MKPKSKPAPVRALLATNLSEAGSSKVAIRLASPAPKLVKILVSTSAAKGSNAATAGVDFRTTSQWVTIKRGAKVGYFTPKIIEDAVDEPNKRLQVRIVKSSKWAKPPHPQAPQRHRHHPRQRHSNPPLRLPLRLPPHSHRRSQYPMRRPTRATQTPPHGSRSHSARLLQNP